MSVTPVSTTAFGAVVTIPGDATVTFTARDLGGGAPIIAIYSVRNSSSIRVSTSTKTKSAVIKIDDTAVTHTVRLEHIENTPAPSGLFFIEALVTENGQPVFPSTWTAQVAGAFDDRAPAQLDFMVAEGSDPTEAAQRGVRVAKERAAALRVVQKLFAKETDAKTSAAKTRGAKKGHGNKRGKDR